MKADFAKSVSHVMGGGDSSTPKKEIEEIRTRKSKNGGYIHTHHHTHPEHHPAEHHTSANDKEMAQHMIASMGQGAAPSGDPSEPAATPDSPAADAGAAVPGTASPTGGAAAAVPGA